MKGESNTNSSNQYEMDSSLSLFKKEMNKYPLLSQDENAHLCLQYQMGDKEAIDTLIKHNLRLILSVSNKYFMILNHLKPMDIIQEASLALTEAALNYDPERGAFSTCATLYMDGYIKRAIYNNEDSIRKPVSVKEAEGRYRRLLAKYAREQKELPSDEEMCKLLKISSETLKYLRNMTDLVPVSTNKKVSDEEDANELEDFIKNETDDYNGVLEKIDKRNLLAVIKSILSPIHYYIVYYRFLADSTKTLEEIAKEINLTRERVRRIQNKALKRIKPYLEGKREKYIVVYNTLYESGKIDVYNISPVTPSKITLYLYVRGYLTDVEKKIFKLQLFGELEIDYYLKDNTLASIYRDIDKSIKEKISERLKEIENYKLFHKNIVRNYGTSVYDLDLEEDIEYINYEKIEGFYNNCSYEEIMQIVSSNNIALDNNELRLLERYFCIPEKRSVQIEYIEKELYLLSFGYKSKMVPIKKEKLLKTFRKYIDEFDLEQRLLLECFYFNVKDPCIYIEKYPDSTMIKHINTIIIKLERMHYNIFEYLYGSFNKNKYKEVVKTYKRLLNKETIRLLNMYYGVKSLKYSVSEIAELENEDYIKIHDRLRDARDYCKSLYYNKTSRLTQNMEQYLPYVLDKKIEFTSETRKILEMFIIKKYTYDKISEKTGLSKYRISNIITDGIRKMDFFRFGMSSNKNFSSEEIDSLYQYNPRLFSELEKEVIRLRYIECINNDEIALLTSKDKAVVNKIIGEFNKAYRKFVSDTVALGNKDIINEINTHCSESVLSDHQKELLSIYFGYQTIYNPKKIKLSREEFMEEYELSVDQFYYRYEAALELIKAKKAGIIRNNLAYISRDQLDELLEDHNLPISDKERDIICYLFELKGYPYKTLKELPELFDDNESSLRRRYQRAILTINKYLNNEIDGKLSYEYDIIPIMKYFSKCDQLLIVEYFVNNLTYEGISKKYNFSFEYVNVNINRIIYNIYDLLNDPDVKKFDFEYYRKHKDDERLPFYGNRELASEVFDMFFGENDIKRLSTPEILKQLDINFSHSAIHKLILDYMLSFCKMKDGIYKVKTFSYEEIKKFYDSYEEELPNYIRKDFLRYFSFIKSDKVVNSRNNRVNDNINYAILKKTYPDFISLKNTTREVILSLMKKHKGEMNPSVKQYLMSSFQISEREFMSGKDKNHVFKILSRIEQTERIIENEIALKRTLD